MEKGRLFSGLLLAALLFSNGVQAQASQLPPPAQELAAEAAFLLDVGTGKVLFEKNPDLPLPPASTTKILTALLLVETADLREVVSVGEEIGRIGPDSSVAKLKIGDRLTVAELVYALLLPSGNDAAYTAAVFVARRLSGFENMDVDKALAIFVRQMNLRAQELGAKNSNFLVPDGYDTPGHTATARDLALITLAAKENDFLAQAAATIEYHWQGIRWLNTNRLLQQDYPQAYYPWATGFKTGYTDKAGHCLVATAQGGGRELVGVILKSSQEQRWPDSRWLLEYGFSQWKNYSAFTQGRQVFTVPVSLLWGREQTVKVLAGESWSDLLSLEQIRDLELTFQWRKGIIDHAQEGLAFKAPLRPGQVLGQAIISCGGQVLGEVDLIAAAWVGAGYYWLPSLGIALLASLAVFLARRRRKRLLRQA